MDQQDAIAQIVKDLRERDQITMAATGEHMTEQFIRGYITGAKAAFGIDIPSYKYPSIVSQGRS